MYWNCDFLMICFHLYFLNSATLVTIYVIEMNFSVSLPKVLREGSLSHILIIGPCYHFMSKIGKPFVIFFQISIFSISTFHKMKTKRYIKILRDASLLQDPINAHSKFEQNMCDRD